jgi:AcrR family transcriptional regulator
MDVADGRAGRTARQRILDAAEEMFAQFGFDGVSMRQISLKAGVPVTLVAYHFGDKLGVYRAVFELRSPVVMEQRKNGLALAELEEDPGRRLEMIVRAALLPMLALRTLEGTGHFGVLMAREVSDPRSADRGILEEIFDPIAVLLTDALSRTMVGSTEAEVHWAFNIVIGTMVYVMADAGRIKRLSGGICDPNNGDATLRSIVPLLLDGLRGHIKAKATGEDR